jgi:TolA-binding protein
MGASSSSVELVHAEDVTPEVKDYFDAFEQSGLVDIESGSKDTLIIDLRRAEALLRGGAFEEAAVALYGIVESPRYEGFEDFVEFQNSQYYLGVALSRAGSYEAALVYLLKAMAAGPSTLYFAPAHRKAVDIALKTRRSGEVLAQLEGLKLNEPIPPGVSGERAYLRARAAYEKDDFAAAEGELVKISRKSRMYSSALYLRGVIRTRKGEFADAAESFCEISATPDDGKFTFVVDERYFRIKDLARLGLARIAHETDHYDNAYYHYFQIPEDSDKLGDALFEAAWSMYQKRELPASRDLLKDFLKQFPSSHLVPEARLLAGYVDLADCEFKDAQKHSDNLVKALEPIVKHIDKLRKNPDKRSRLFDKALKRWREERAVPDEQVENKLATKSDQVLALLRFDEDFVRVHEAVAGLRRAVGNAPHVARSWSALSKRMSNVKVRGNKEEASVEEMDARDSQSLVGDLQNLNDQVAASKSAIRRALREESITEAEAEEERKRLQALEEDISKLETRALAAAEAAAVDQVEASPDGLKPLIRADIKESRQLEGEARELLGRLETLANTMAKESLDKLYMESRRVLDKAKLGKIDSVIGQKRKLEIEVQDLASGRFPPELHGHLWEQGLIGDDEEYWPFEGEYWADEYEGWR